MKHTYFVTVTDGVFCLEYMLVVNRHETRFNYHARIVRLGAIIIALQSADTVGCDERWKEEVDYKIKLT